MKIAGQLERAIQIAAVAHAGQVDKAGKPYILHVLRVMQAVSTDEQRVVAVLHDVVEDCPDWGFDRLGEHGFSGAVLEAVDALTRRRNEPYETYILRVKDNPIARAVKLADLTDNSDINRIGATKMTESDWERVRKYGRAASVLLA